MDQFSRLLGSLLHFHLSLIAFSFDFTIAIHVKSRHITPRHTTLRLATPRHATLRLAAPPRHVPYFHHQSIFFFANSASMLPINTLLMSSRYCVRALLIGRRRRRCVSLFVAVFPFRDELISNSSFLNCEEAHVAHGQSTKKLSIYLFSLFRIYL